MEKKGWKKRLTSSYSYSMGESEYFMIDGEETNIDDLKDFISQELDKAREEGYQEGVEDGIEGKIFKKVEIKEEAHIPKELIEKIKRDGYDIGYEKGYERGIKYGTTGNTLTDSDIEEFERLDKKERERFLKSIY